MLASTLPPQHSTAYTPAPPTTLNIERKRTPPLTPRSKATTHFISTKEFELLHAANPSGTYLANIARGQIVDQPALVKALEGKLISGAALDVTDPEPLPADDPLWEAPNVLITPHVSAVTDTLGVRIFEVVRENLRRKRDGKPLVNLVNRKKGY